MPNMNGKLHKDHRSRIRKRFREQGLESFADHEILEFLLYYAIPRRDTNPLAHMLLNEYQTLANVLEADPASLAKLPGMGEQSATLLSMIPQLARAYARSKSEKTALLHDTTSIGAFAVSMMQGKVREEFDMICLDSCRRIQWHGCVIKGGLDQVQASPRTVVSEIVKHNAKYVIFVHNHPGGTLLPSPSDKEVTNQLSTILKSIDAVIIDHIIVSDNRFYSMKESGFTF